jgi:hypothetical protein
MSDPELQVVDDLAPAEAEDMPTSETAPEAEPDVKLVPVTESIRYRRRAQAAEQQLTELRRQYTELQQSLEEAEFQVALTERRRQIDQMLIESDAIDLEAARLLTEATIDQMDDADVALAVEELRQRKPYLFRRAASPAGVGGSMSPHPRRNGHPASEAAEAAAVTGDRRDLLRYLRMRRRGGGI